MSPVHQTQTDILDIDSIIVTPWDTIITITVAVLVIILIAALIYYFIKKRKRIKVDLRTPEEILLDELNQLRLQKFIENKLYKKYYFFISEIFRNYLQKTFHFPALEMTTSEIENNLDQISLLDKDTVKNIKSFMHETDLIKFSDQASLGDYLAHEKFLADFAQSQLNKSETTETEKVNTNHE